MFKSHPKEEEGRPGLPSIWIFLPGLAVALGLMYFSSSRAPKSWWAAGFGIFAPFLAGAVSQLLRRQIARILAAIVLAEYWAGAGIVFALTLFNVVAILYFAFILWFLTVPSVAILICATVSVRRRMGPRWATASAWSGVACGAIATLIVAMPALKKATDLASYVPPLNPLVLMQDMITIDKCSHGFINQYPELGYPESLEQIGPQGTECIPENLLQSEYKGFVISYQPKPRDAQGKVSGYSVNAREARPRGKAFSTVSTDESGLVFYSNPGPDGRSVPSSHSPAAAMIYSLNDCIWHATRTHNVLQADHDAANCARNPRSVVRRKFNSDGYNFSYDFDLNSDGTIRGFTLEARPEKYGILGIRSYFVVHQIGERVDTVRMYATAEDRRATTHDDLARMCEIRSFNSCATPAQIY